jgi:hypothetical protein
MHLTSSWQQQLQQIVLHVKTEIANDSRQTDATDAS